MLLNWNNGTCKHVTQFSRISMGGLALFGPELPILTNQEISRVFPKIIEMSTLHDIHAAGFTNLTCTRVFSATLSCAFMSQLEC